MEIKERMDRAKEVRQAQFWAGAVGLIAIGLVIGWNFSAHNWLTREPGYICVNPLTSEAYLAERSTEAFHAMDDNGIEFRIDGSNSRNWICRKSEARGSTA